MNVERTLKAPNPIVDPREEQLLESLTVRYEKLVKPGPVRRLGARVAKRLPEPVKRLGSSAMSTITEQGLYEAALNVMGTGFKSVQGHAARFSIREAKVIAQVNAVTDAEVDAFDKVCLARGYDIAAIVMKRRSENLFAAFVEGAATGMPGFVGIPFNLVLSTFLYFRAVQVVAMSYGYDVKGDAAEMEIAGQVFANSMDPAAKESGNDMAAIIGKIMLVSEASVLKQTAAKTWTDMAARGGTGLLLTQMRTLANRAAQSALESVGKAGLETSVFRAVFEQIGHKLTLKAVQRAVPVVSGAIGAFFDAGQMQKVIEYSDIFYAKRFILEKETRINMLGIGIDDVAEA